MAKPDTSADSRKVPLSFRAAVAVLPVFAALSVLPAGPASAAAPLPPGQVRVTEVLRGPGGQLVFHRAHAADRGAAAALAAQWRQQPDVVAAAVDTQLHVSGSPDPLAPQQWGLTTLHADQVGSAAGQVVAVVDTGVDAGHPDLAGVVLAGTDFVAPGGDGTTDPNGHGTHVSGIIAADANNGIGGAGLAQGAKILPVRVMAADGTGWDSDVAAGVSWAADHGASVINLSLGGPTESSVMDAAVQYALGRGVSVVVAAGNDGDNGNPVEWPAADPGVLAVGAVDVSGVRPSWSSTGSFVSLVAPGVDILSTVPVTSTNPSGYATWSGTSMATPFVTASVALLRAAQPALTVAEVRQRLMASADDLGPAGFDPAYGAGRVDVLAAEGITPTSTSTPTPTPTPTLAPTPTPTLSPAAAAAAPPAASSPVVLPPTAPSPSLTARISTSRPAVVFPGPVSVSVRVLADGVGIAGQQVVLERRTGSSWLLTRVGSSGAAGLTSWLLRPDQTAVYRVVGVGWVSPLVRIAVIPRIQLEVARSGAVGRVLPGLAVPVRLLALRGGSWSTFAVVTSRADGLFRLNQALAVGTEVRALAAGTSSAVARV